MVKRIFFDTGLLSAFCTDRSGIYYNSFLDISTKCGLSIENRRVTVENNWFLFLEFIGLGRVMDKASLCFDKPIEKQILYYFDSPMPTKVEQINKIIETAYEDCISSIQKIEALDPSNLVSLFDQKNKRCSSNVSKNIIPLIAGRYEKNLKFNPHNAHLQICCNLAWEILLKRFLSLVSQSSIKKYPERILKLFQPLISIWHRICLDFGTQPSFFRLVETSYLATVSKQANMCTDTHLKLKTYKQKYQTRSKSDLADCSYLDFGMIGHLSQSCGEILQFPVTVFTCDKPCQVSHRLSLFQYMLEKLQEEVEGWSIFPQYGCNVFCLELYDGYLKFVDSVSHPILML